MAFITARFWKQTAERAVKTTAQTLIVLWGADGLNVLAIDWPTAGGLAAGAALLSVLTSLVSSKSGEPDTPSLTE